MGAEFEIMRSGIYHAKTSGRIFSQWSGREKEIRLCKKPSGYLKFNAYAGSGPITVYAHRFIWAFFHGEIPPGFQINHINFNRSDNRIFNLEIMSPGENTRYSAEAGRMSIPKNKGVKNIRAKLSEQDVIAIRYSSLPTRELCAFFGVGGTTIREIRLEKSWGHLWGN
jgi:hypothetical protein